MTDQAIPFRTPTQAAVAPTAAASVAAPDTTTQSAKTDTADAPPSLYQNLEKKPYAIKHLGLELYGDDEDFAEVQKHAKDLDEYVLKQIKARGMKDEPGSYKEVVDAIYKEIGRSPNEDPTKAVRRLSIAASALSRLQTAKLPAVLDAASLSPNEYEGIQP